MDFCAAAATAGQDRRRTRSLAESRLTFRVWELLVITLVLQIGMLPLMARDFHRITLSGPVVNLAAVPMTGIVVPLGFLDAWRAGCFLRQLGKILAVPLAG